MAAVFEAEERIKSVTIEGVVRFVVEDYCWLCFHVFTLSLTHLSRLYYKYYTYVRYHTNSLTGALKDCQTLS